MFALIAFHLYDHLSPEPLKLLFLQLGCRPRLNFRLNDNGLGDRFRHLGPPVYRVMLS